MSRRDLIPELGIAATAVGITTLIHWVLVMHLGENPPQFLFLATAAGLTFWRGLGPGILASSMGSAIGSAFAAAPFSEFASRNAQDPLDTVLMFGGSLFTCWLIYHLRVTQEDTELVERRRNDALTFVSHELRQPLSNITLAADILRRDSSEDTRNRLSHLIANSATRLETLVNDLEDVARLQSGVITMNLAPARLQDVLLDAADSAHAAIKHKQQNLEIEVDLDPPLWIKGDATRLEQVVSNLLLNASKYSPEGAEISLSSRAEDTSAVVTVRDTGVGIGRDMLETIFEPFVREAPASAPGLGIGLTLARNLVEQHGGQIWAQSEGPGHGSEFVVKLPLLRDEVGTSLRRQVGTSIEPSPPGAVEDVMRAGSETA